MAFFLTLVCDCCDNFRAGEPGDDEEDLRRQVERRGWRETTVGSNRVFLCQTCLRAAGVQSVLASLAEAKGGD